MEQGKWRTPLTEHEEVYHAASWCQAASLSLTPRRLHDGKRACSVKGKKRGGFASQAPASLSRSWGMRALSSQESGRLIALVPTPYTHGLRNEMSMLSQSAPRVTSPLLPAC